MNVAFIPVRGGSKSIPLKNIKIINGKPLIYWTAVAASGCEYIDKVYVATDSDAIRDTVNSLNIPKVEVIDRDPATATDTASTESAMLDFASRFDFDNIVLVQATSPMLTAEDINGGFELYNMPGTDSVLSTVRQKRFNWTNDAEGFASPLNYDYMHRPRRQEFDGYMTENGAFYITSKERLLATGNRISGNIRAYEMPEDTFYEIDEPSDFEIIEGMMQKHRKTPKEEKLIKLFLTDCDGCLTDGGMYYTPDGDTMKRFNAKDGMGISLLRQSGIITGIITGENSQIVAQRAKKLSMEEVHLGIKDKVSCVKEICTRLGIDMSEVAYLGDDINDVAVMKEVGYAFSVPNAEENVKPYARFISSRCGGYGAVRDVAEEILRINGKAENDFDMHNNAQ